ncbi:MAG TPA: integration host factor subunit alpha, partial [Clostridiales bacterium]|nr:integration host factor subunit alpha [Clostridiales bacterium]
FSKKDTEKVINATFNAITDELVAGEKISLVGFGSFDVKYRGERIGRNPKTKEEIKIPASRVPQFKAGKALKEIVAK